ncbi:MAG: prepilin-type N-terminal cleavage/methylation domain-containing protein [Armatimonadetes bacterium]|nr:prepilin-type N-terminal cleavage/methylation domain-containing protein [Armatimonadota bacterium]MDE2207762.1 prepilin-type N-terminal cleavage/methylation domain-containing protein [Armatimonadota bacterium]
MVRAARSGFTLLEAIVAMVMMAVIMTALALAMSVALQAQERSSHDLTDSGSVRAAFNTLTQDFHGATASNSGVSVFVAGGQGGGSSAAAAFGNLVTLTTDSNIVAAPDLTMSAGSINPQQMQNSATMPQTDALVVRYDFDQSRQELIRTVSPVPDLADVETPDTSAQGILCQHVLNISIQYWDLNQLTWRSTWDYEGSLGSDFTATSTGTSTGAGAASGSSSSSSSTSTLPPGQNAAGQDTVLPALVDISMTVADSSGIPHTSETWIPIAVTQPIDRTPGTPPSTSTSGGTGSTGG